MRAGLLISIAAMPLLTAGVPACRVTGPHPSSAANQSDVRVTARAFREQAMAAADSYTFIIAQAADALRERTARPEVHHWALEQKAVTAVASYSNATHASETFALLDMMVFATLKRAALEEHWIPTLLHDEGAELLEAYRRGEAAVWQHAGRVLSAEQLEEVRGVIDEWKRNNPRQYYAAFIRFSDFDAVRNLSPTSAKVKVPGSIFGLLFLDPLSGLDPVAQEIRGYRALTERLVYLGVRMPVMLQWQMQLATHETAATPQLMRVIASTEQFAAATDRFADAFAQYPQQLSAERKAAIEQVAAGMTEQREAVLRELDGQHAQLQRLVSDAVGVVAQAEKAALSVNEATAQTVNASEQATHRIIEHAFRRGLAFTLVLLLGIPSLLLLYRFMAQRLQLRRQS